MNRRRSARLAALAAFALVLAAAATAAETPEEIFARGNSAYDQGRFEEAAEAYATLLRYGIEDSRVEYNLGNAEFRRGRLGSAILHFERARRLAPADEDIAENLAYARSLRRDRVPAEPLPGALRAAIVAQDRVGVRGHAWLFVILLWLVSAMLAWSFAVPGRFGPLHGWGLAALVALALAVAVSWRVTWNRFEGRRVAVVLRPAVELLAGPGANNATLATIHEGLDVELLGEREDWLQVRLPGGGVSGWLPRDAVEPVR